MAPVVTRERPGRARFERPRRGGGESFAGSGRAGLEPGRASLDERITGIWRGLVDAGTAECPVCESELVAGSPCGHCGSELR